MTNIMDNIEKEIRNIIGQALKEAEIGGVIPCVTANEISIEMPREKEHGDYSTNIAMQISKQAGMPPIKIAETLISYMETSDTYIEKVERAGAGFINFFLKNSYLYDTLKVIMSKGSDYGKINLGNGLKVMVEFVSANPTGPLHMGNARGGALGDCIASVLEEAGYEVTREFYINDAGNQIEKFGVSLEARYLQLLQGEDAIVFPEDGYHGEDIIEHMRSFIRENGDGLLNEGPEKRRSIFVKYALDRNLKGIKRDLASYGINYDSFFSEQSLYGSGELGETLEYFKEKGHTFEEDGALWFKTSEFGCEKDDVIVRNNGIPTYYASDLAYHRNKFIKRGFDRVINLWGADHHGHVGRMKAGIKALGIDEDRLNIVIFQLVRLFRHGEAARMSKRTGKAISLSDLLEEVGRDAARFFFNTKVSGSHLDFDLDLAVQKSSDNPVYYVQYAYARICSMLKILEEEGIRVPDADSVNLELLECNEEIDLIKKLADYPGEIRVSAQTLEPSRLTRYVLELAALFHSFYNACRVKGERDDLLKSRLVLVECTRIVIKNVLGLLKINAPERM